MWLDASVCSCAYCDLLLECVSTSIKFSFFKDPISSFFPFLLIFHHPWIFLVVKNFINIAIQFSYQKWILQNLKYPITSKLKNSKSWKISSIEWECSILKIFSYIMHPRNSLTNFVVISSLKKYLGSTLKRVVIAISNQGNFCFWRIKWFLCCCSFHH